MTDPTETTCARDRNVCHHGVRWEDPCDDCDREIMGQEDDPVVDHQPQTVGRES